MHVLKDGSDISTVLAKGKTTNACALRLLEYHNTLIFIQSSIVPKTAVNPLPLLGPHHHAPHHTSRNDQSSHNSCSHETLLCHLVVDKAL